MKKKLISWGLMLILLMQCCMPTAFADGYSAWSPWSTTVPASSLGREIRTQDVIVGYNMELFLTMTPEGVREYRSYSVNGNYEAYGLRRAYGEHHYTYYETKAKLDAAETAAEGAFVEYAQNTKGYNKGHGTAYVGWGVQDCLVWFISSEVTERQYSYRDPLPNSGPGTLTYQVIFKDWDGTVLKTDYVEGGKSATPPANPRREGYIFTGWSGSYQQIRENLTLTAQYKREPDPKYKVYFDATGGISSFDSKEVTQGKTYGDLPTAKRDGYTFGGWYTATDGGTLIDSSSIVNLTSNTTLYAHWSKANPAGILVTFDPNGGTVGEECRFFVIGEPCGKLPIPSREGYSFNGWYTASIGGSKITSSTVVSPDFNLILYARWIDTRPKSFTVYFDPNEGSCDTPSKIVTQGESYGKLPFPERNGFDFLGWHTSKSGGSKVTSSTTVSLTANQTLYAHWEKQNSGITVKDLSFRFGNSYSAFGYSQDYKIPLARYQLIFGNTTFASTAYLSSGLWGGNCYGEASASGEFTENNEIDVSSFRSGATAISQLSLSDWSRSLNITLQEFIEAMQISQISPVISKARSKNGNNLIGIASTVASFQRTGKNPAIICVYGTKGGHALLGYELREINSAESRIYVYDCNFPLNENRYITLYKNSAGQYTGWYYRLNDTYDWGSSFPDGYISYIPYESYYSVWNNRAGINENMVNMTFNVASATIYDAEYNPVATIENGRLTASRDDVYPVMYTGITDDGYTASDSGFSLWLPTDLYIVESDDSKSRKFEISVVNVEQAAQVSTTADTVTLVVDDSQQLNFVQIEESGESYEITLTSSIAGTYSDVRLSGTTLDRVLSLSQIAGTPEINGAGANDKFYIDGKQVSISSLSQSHGTVGGLPLVDYNAFSDVRRGAFYYDAVQWAIAKGITNGTSATTFSPDASCSRGELLTFLWRAAGSPEPKKASARYRDLDAGSFYYKAILWALENDIADGQSSTIFAPGQTVDRAEFVTYLYRFFGKPSVSGSSTFSDVPKNASYADAVAWAVKQGVTNGTSATTFSPSGLCTRGQAMTFLHRAFAAVG